MAANAKSNVVNLSSHERARRAFGAVESGRMLNDCRDLAMRRLSASLKDMLAQVEEDLFQMAEESYDREMQNLYLEVRGKAKEKWPKIQSAFSRNFVEAFNRKAHGQIGSAVQSVAASVDDLKLVDEDELAESIALQSIATHMRESCEDELGALGERVAVLLDRNQISDEENPISPMAVCAALKSACDELEGSVKLKLVLLKQLERHVANALHQVYADLNTELMRWNVLPGLKRGYHRPKGAAAGGSQSAAKRGDAQPPENGQAPDLFSTLQQLMQSQYASGAFAPGAAPAGQSSPVLTPVSGALAPISEVFSRNFVESLTQLQRGEMPVSEAGYNYADNAAALSTVNILRQIKETALAQGLGQLDAITIDIVAMLFDFIFDDAKVPDAIKALIGRLQIPVLKVAMLDKSFFSSRTHPARRLLDGISHASMGWGDEVGQDDPLYKEIASIVGRVQTQFESDVALFSELLGELEAFLAAREAQADALAERSADFLEERENAEIAWVIAGEAVSRRLSSAAPAPVREFLLDHWQQVLKETYLRHGEEHPAFASAAATMDNLIWSVEPKTNSEERKKLVGTLSTLLRELNAGLDLIGLPQDARGRFFDTLVTLHSGAVKAGLQGAGAPGGGDSTRAGATSAGTDDRRAPSAQAHPVNRDGEIFVTRMVQDDVQIEEVALVGARRASVAPGDMQQERVAQLRRGDWVAFHQDCAPPMRARLSWVSPQRGVYLFTSPHSARAMAISPEALARQLRYGLAEILVDEPLFERAVNGVLGSLQVA